MGCGIIKVNESNDYDDDKINQSELLPEIEVNKQSNLEEQNQNLNNNKNSENNSENNTKKSLENKNNIKQITINKNIKEATKLNLQDNKNENENKKEIISNINSYNSSIDKESENSNNNEENKNELEDNHILKNKKINNYENDKNNSMLTRKAYTTDKLPHSKANITLSSMEEEKLPKVIENISNLSNGFIDKKCLEIELKANRYETIYPIWIQKEEEIEFIVQGKWKINTQTECNEKGIELNEEEEEDNINKEKNKFNNGALIGRILKGEPFPIYNGLKYVSEISGPLILKMYLNSLWNKEQPEGCLKIKIYGAQKIQNITDLEEKIGWWKQLRVIEFNNKDDLPNYKISKTEKLLIILFNKLRHDSKLFASQYLDNYQRLTPTTKKIYNQFISNQDQFIPFKINLSIVKLLKNFYDMLINENKNNIKEENWIYVLRSENYLQKYLEESFNNKKKIFVTIVRYYEENPFYLGLRILFRDNIRNNMLNYNFEELSLVNFCNNQKNGKNIYYCIVVLSNQVGNDKINYESNMNMEQFIDNEKKFETKDSIVKQIKL